MYTLWAERYKKTQTCSSLMTLETAKVRLAVKSQWDRMYVLGIILAYLFI